MDCLTFWSDVIRSLAWPTGIVLAVLLLRKPLTRLLPRLRRLKYGDLEAVFGGFLQETEQEALETRSPEPIPASERPPVSLTARDLLPISPSEAVLDAWKEVDATARDVAKRHGIKGHYSARVLPNKLADAGMLDAAGQRKLERLRQLRNIAAQMGDLGVNHKDAATYLGLASEAIGILRIRGGSRPAKQGN